MFERILVPLDSSDLANIVLPYAESLAGVLGSEVTLIYVCEPEEKQFRRVHEFYLGKISELVTSHIKDAFPAREPASLRVNSLVPCGKPHEEISSYAKENNVSLVIMPRHGRTGIMRRLMAPIADRVFRATGIPLLLITSKPPKGVAPTQLLDRILVPLDGTQAGEAALPYVEELARRLPIEAILLRVITPVYEVRSPRGLQTIRFTDQQIEASTTNAQKYLRELGQRLAETKALVEHEVMVGDPTAEIIEAANKEKTRLVALSTHHYPGTKEWRTEEIAQRILLATDTPVLLVKAPD